jgi:hypothetical protein
VAEPHRFAVQVADTLLFSYVHLRAHGRRFGWTPDITRYAVVDLVANGYLPVVAQPDPRDALEPQRIRRSRRPRSRPAGEHPMTASPCRRVGAMGSVRVGRARNSSLDEASRERAASRFPLVPPGPDARTQAASSLKAVVGCLPWETSEPGHRFARDPAVTGVAAASSDAGFAGRRRRSSIWSVTAQTAVQITRVVDTRTPPRPKAPLAEVEPKGASPWPCLVPA